MKRDEKNMLSRRRILDSAFKEFGELGYGLSSVNTICSSGGISKGILYYYFADKDELYLACVKEMLDALTDHLSSAMIQAADSGNSLELYFDARDAFFHEKPLYHRLFCDIVMRPPEHLSDAIGNLKVSFDELNISILTELLSSKKLRAGVTIESAVETFRLYQDFINARYYLSNACQDDLEKHEQICRHSLSILLYGVIERDVQIIERDDQI